MTTLHYELTDLFGGEANYAWVKRGVISKPKQTLRGNITHVKRLLALSGVRHTTTDYGDTVRIDFTRGGYLAVLFLSWE
jgi:hypothetical protein